MINSILDTDLYKLTMQQAALALYPDAIAEYRFINRRPTDDFGEGFAERLRVEIGKMAELELTQEEFEWLPRLPFLGPGYLHYLKNFKFDPSQVTVSDDSQDHLSAVQYLLGD